MILMMMVIILIPITHINNNHNNNNPTNINQLIQLRKWLISHKNQINLTELQIIFNHQDKIIKIHTMNPNNLVQIIIVLRKITQIFNMHHHKDYNSHHPDMDNLNLGLLELPLSNLFSQIQLLINQFSINLDN